MKTVIQGKNSGMRWYLLGILIAVELLMSFSFLGYFHVEPISITIAYIPVLLAGALLGPAESSILGFVFGLASMWKASAHYVMDFDQLFSPLMSGYPIKSMLLSIGTRVLFGLAVGLLYQAVRRFKHPLAGMAAVSFFGPAIHSFFVYSALWMFFPETGYTPLALFENFRSLNNLLTYSVSMGLVLLIWEIMKSSTWKQFQKRVKLAQTLRISERYHTLSLICSIFLTLLFSIAVAIYFVNRMESVLDQNGVSMTDTEHADLLHLQIQFLIGMLAVMGLVIIFLILNRQYTTYMNWEAMRDALTGVLNRKAFFQSCTKVLKDIDAQEERCAYFIMIDLDYFKKINDCYGHSEGDRALKEAAQELEMVFGHEGFVGRVGGDEFAVLLYTPVSRDEIERKLQYFLSRLNKIKLKDRLLSCSIGANPVLGDETMENLYRSADKLLYMAKERGRNQYVLGDRKIHATEETVL